MHPRKIIITNEDILYAETILLSKGQHFDRERRDFIKNLDTIDLHAVPGSGKTTALLAKLLILEKYLPLTDGSGILVISHTNKAIDEIKKKISFYCPKLFSYPNFVGTIQSFVDEFLAIPFYQLKFQQKISFIDEEKYTKKAKEFSYKSIAGFMHDEQQAAKHFLRVKDIANSYRFDFINGKFALVERLNGNPLQIVKPKGRTRPENYQDYSEDEKERIEEWLKQFKSNLFREGILHFDDAYFLAEYYIKDYPPIIKIIQKRFRFVFVDEMQDMEKHQYNLLEEIFYKKFIVRHCYQRIGDINQAIYSSSNSYENKWDSTGRKILVIRGSYRLSPPIANIVKFFGLNFIDIDGRNNSVAIKPYIIVYDDQTINKVLLQFRELIQIHKLDCIPNASFKAIGWRKYNKDITKLVIKKYYQDFNKISPSSKEKIERNCLKAYLVISPSNKREQLKDIMYSIYNALLQILREEKIFDENEKYFIRSRLLSFLLKKSIHDNSNIYNIFLKNIYTWCVDIYKNNVDCTYEAIKDYIPEFLKLFGGYHINNSADFINLSISDNDNVEVNNLDRISKTDNIYTDAGIEIFVDTIHSVKGQTHTATLYLETSYQGDYESIRLSNPLKGLPHRFSYLPNEDVYNKQTIKMAYVGFSRPTHLLCFAVHKDRLPTDGTYGDAWEIDWSLITKDTTIKSLEPTTIPQVNAVLYEQALQDEKAEAII